VRQGLKAITESQKELQTTINRLDGDMREHKAESDSKHEELSAKISSAHARIDVIEPELQDLKNRPARHSQDTLSWVLKTAGYFIISGLIVLITLGAQEYFG
jgi:lipid II:glycine glycyltransferase (peptidoglycan interpeptide bridge formation enzyme)